MPRIENKPIIRNSLLDGVGLNGVRAGWSLVRESGRRDKLATSVAVIAAAVGGVESFIAPNITRDFIVDDYASTSSEYNKGFPGLVASHVLDMLSWFGVVGVGILTKQLEAAVATKVGLNAVNSALVRKVDAIQTRKARRDVYWP